jgi:hypothetical protein
MNSLPASVLKKQKKVKDPRSLANTISQNATPQDREYMEQFVNTQMMISHLENNYCAFD